ncbi:hypothetical protein [Paraconexibacter algicola]|uniref:Uncharacterized protein n=1 Tax=Paraconexibacter algicola TaxID=2133960 RepID=A0A2T4UE41_9ACTN|nr:hypothetical protein [Paraconexibacter algicola]PTL55735.1 hypothetical protein C7Y72_19085 [Paraconexibacter algicola]
MTTVDRNPQMDDQGATPHEQYWREAQQAMARERDKARVEVKLLRAALEHAAEIARDAAAMRCTCEGYYTCNRCLHDIANRAEDAAEFLGHVLQGDEATLDNLRVTYGICGGSGEPMQRDDVPYVPAALLDEARGGFERLQGIRYAEVVAIALTAASTEDGDNPHMDQKGSDD